MQFRRQFPANVFAEDLTWGLGVEPVSLEKYNIAQTRHPKLNIEKCEECRYSFYPKCVAIYDVETNAKTMPIINCPLCLPRP